MPEHKTMQPTIKADLICPVHGNVGTFVVEYKVDFLKENRMICALNEDVKPVKHCMECHKEGKQTEVQFGLISITKALHDVQDTFKHCEVHK